MSKFFRSLRLIDWSSPVTWAIIVVSVLLFSHFVVPQFGSFVPLGMVSGGWYDENTHICSATHQGSSFPNFGKTCNFNTVMQYLPYMKNSGSTQYYACSSWIMNAASGVNSSVFTRVRTLCNAQQCTYNPYDLSSISCVDCQRADGVYGEYRVIMKDSCGNVRVDYSCKRNQYFCANADFFINPHATMCIGYRVGSGGIQPAEGRCFGDIPVPNPVVTCGDGVCDSSESYSSCSNDCPRPVVVPYCGDGNCDVKESSVSCPNDCKIVEHCGGEPKCQPELGETKENCNDCSVVNDITGWLVIGGLSVLAVLFLVAVLVVVSKKRG